ncbi:MAG: phosphate signaling complex protein PhoU [Myxococcales bacterium]|nr:phosphate signaling complex protein PhoU [Myxococcales bacterium]
MAAGLAFGLGALWLRELGPTLLWGAAVAAAALLTGRLMAAAPAEPATQTPDGDAALDQIQERLLYMAGLVERMVTDASTALRTRDPELARKVVEADDAVDQQERQVDALCQAALERHPARPGGVMLITRAMKMVTDLERIADLAVSIARRVAKLAERPNTPADDFLPGLAHAVQSMVSDAVDAFVRRDAHLARAVIAQDDVVDVRFHAYRRATVDWMEADASHAKLGLDLQNVGKRFERMADHATNLAEHVIFLVDGNDVRHRRPDRTAPPPTDG